MEVLREFEKSVNKMYEEHIRMATAYMDETQREIYKIGFDMAINFSKTFIVESDLVFGEVEL